MNRIFAALLAATLICHASILHASPSHEPSKRTPVRSLREAARREGVRLATVSESRSAAQAPTHERNWIARHPVLVGTLAGAGVGLGFAAASDCESSSDYTCGGIALFFAGTGAGLGALGGFVVSLFIR
jgi:hypothetical protein